MILLALLLAYVAGIVIGADGPIFVAILLGIGAGAVGGFFEL